MVIFLTECICRKLQLKSILFFFKACGGYYQATAAGVEWIVWWQVLKLFLIFYSLLLYVKLNILYKMYEIKQTRNETFSRFN